ncbi:hypothetical protein JCM17844_09730 [Iodidimonas gelatinilytica]|uniref:Uncharacterized protein n=1 Tax=Iodidimonas gelatinilytica TaxID=1236966 RepID=A0A5A7MNA9_9PROT|nr:hypothetical protein JCM17844_09730 [Iodidimonas gelatinilytica]GEQ99660.1 hypothetical protein JCM17845_02840 [Iodidimonas gelatinilytica]
MDESFPISCFIYDAFMGLSLHNASEDRPLQRRKENTPVLHAALSAVRYLVPKSRSPTSPRPGMI